MTYTTALPELQQSFAAYTDQLEICPYQTSRDYFITEINGAFHWEGHPSSDYCDWCSEDGWEDINACIADVIFSLYRLDGNTAEDAATLVHELGLPAVSEETAEYDFEVLEDN